MPKKRKPLLQRLEESAAIGSRSVTVQNRAAILRLRKEIQEAANKGYTLLAIWKVLHHDGEVKMSYSQFLRLAAAANITASKGRKKASATPAAADEDAPYIKVVESKGFLANTNFGVADPYGKRKNNNPDNR